MRAIATDAVACSVCLCICWSRSWALQNGWTDRDVVYGAYSGGPNEPYIRRGPDSRGEGAIFGLPGPFKSIVS